MPKRLLSSQSQYTLHQFKKKVNCIKKADKPLDGLRKVTPYYFTFKTHCKGRWFGKRLIDVYRNEFRLYSPEEYERKIEKGYLRVNENQVKLDYILKNGDKLQSKVHRHETPVNSHPDIVILNNDKNVVIVEKPSSIPVHPCGNFRLNSLMCILAKQYNINNLYSIHRIDRLTSGLVLFAKNLETFHKMQGDILNKTAIKEYLCLVEGIFDKNIAICKEPIKIFSYKIGISAVVKNAEIEGAKECSTKFERLAVIAYNTCPSYEFTNLYHGIEENIKFMSLLKCQPLTGRTHQIRVHAQYLGHPIINDPLYNTILGWGPFKGKFCDYKRPLDDVIKDLIISSNQDPIELPKTVATNNQDNSKDKLSRVKVINNLLVKNDTKSFDNSLRDQISFYSTGESAIFPPWYDPECIDCVKEFEKMNINPKFHDILSSGDQIFDFKYTNEFPMYLHCFKYSGLDWSYSTRLPCWADISSCNKYEKPSKEIESTESHSDNPFSNIKSHEIYSDVTLNLKSIHECNSKLIFDQHNNFTERDNLCQAIYRSIKTHGDSDNYQIGDKIFYLNSRSIKGEILFQKYPDDYNPLLRHLSATR
ncbi:unnamed protein product [Gordionus sp. m RMFG-2023]